MCTLGLGVDVGGDIGVVVDVGVGACVWCPCWCRCWCWCFVLAFVAGGDIVGLDIDAVDLSQMLTRGAKAGGRDHAPSDTTRNTISLISLQTRPRLRPYLQLRPYPDAIPAPATASFRFRDTREVAGVQPVRRASCYCDRQL